MANYSYGDYGNDSYNDYKHGNHSYRDYGNYSYTDGSNDTRHIRQMGLEMANLMFLYLGFPIIIFGTLANILAFVVLQTKTFRNTSSGFVLCALAVADTGALNTGFLRRCILAASDHHVDVSVVSNAACKVHTYVSFVFPQLSSWTLVLLTLERLLSVVMPLRAKDICTKTRVAIAWSLVFVAVAIIDAPIMGTMELHDNPLWNTSDIEPGDKITPMACVYAHHERFWRGIWPGLYGLQAAILPGIIILVTNIVIFKRLASARRQRCMLVMRGTQGTGDRPTKSLTPMLISISVLFIVATTTPFLIRLCGYATWSSGSAQDAYNQMIGYTVGNIILHCNYALNFVMYCISGSKFRTALVGMCCWPRKTRATPSGRKSSSSQPVTIETEVP